MKNVEKNIKIGKRQNIFRRKRLNKQTKKREKYLKVVEKDIRRDINLIKI